MNIRRMEFNDIPACRIVISNCWGIRIAQTSEPELADSFTSSAFKPVFYVCQIDKEIVGIASYNTSLINYGIYNLCWVSTKINFRNRGIAKCLINRCLEDLFPIANAIILTTDIPIFYQKNWNFEILAPIDLNKKEENILMILRINH